MHSTLNINNRKAFDQAVFQTDTEFDTLKYNEWKDNATKALQRIYDQIDDIPSIETADCYILGDIINLLSDMTIDADHRAETWTVTADRHSNALYLYLRKTRPDEDYGAIFLHSEVKGDEYDSLDLTDTERRIARIMASNEERMALYGERWNEDGVTDYESAMEKLIAIIENNPKADIESDADNTPYINE